MTITKHRPADSGRGAGQQGTAFFGARGRVRRGLLQVVAMTLLGVSSVLLPPATTVPPAWAALPPRGSVAVGGASYPVPSGALFVSPSGNNANPGAVGAPVRSLATAFSKVATGGTVVLRGGTYHDSATASRRVTVQNYPGEIVWLDGSVVVSGWVSTGTTWTKSGWTKEFSSLMGGDAAFKARFVDGSFPMAADPDQVFVNGVALTQVGSSSAPIRPARRCGPPTSPRHCG
jgi:hypothetical protein